MSKVGACYLDSLLKVLVKDLNRSADNLIFVGFVFVSAWASRVGGIRWWRVPETYNGPWSRMLVRNVWLVHVCVVGTYLEMRYFKPSQLIYRHVRTTAQQFCGWFETLNKQHNKTAKLQIVIRKEVWGCVSELGVKVHSNLGRHFTFDFYIF